MLDFNYLTSTSSSTASIRAGLSFSVDIVFDGQAHSWALFIDIAVDGQFPLDFL
jgi:hypothetical protein